MGENIPFLKSNAAFGSAYYLVKATSNEYECQLTSDPTDEVIGVTNKKPQASGDLLEVVPIGGGLKKLIAEGTIAKDEPICPSGTTNGAARGAAGDLNCNVIGYALHAAADGESFYAVLDRRTSVLDYTVNAEVSDVITIDLQLNGLAGAGGAKRYLAEVYDNATGLVEADTAFTIDETGDGTEVSTGTEPRLVFALSAAGAAQLSVSDVVTASGKTTNLIITPLNHEGATLFIPLTFD